MCKRILVLLLLFPLFSIAQINGKLSYEQAVELALKNNFDLQLAKISAEEAQIQNNYGAAGFLPKLDVNAAASKSSNNTLQEFSSGLSVDKKGVSSNNITAGAYLTWTIFDGMKMFATKQRLNLLEQQGELSFKIQLENTLEQVSNNYYLIVKQEQLIKGINALLAVSEERIKIAQKKAELGSGSDVELLQAKLDRNAQKSNLIAQQNLANEYKNNLLLLLKADAETSFAVDTNFAFETQKSSNEIKQKIESANNNLLFAQKNVLIRKQSGKEIQALSLPKIGLSGNYVFGKTENAAGFALLNQNLGYNLGVNFTWNIFNGFTTKNQLKVNHLSIEAAKLEVESEKNILFSKANIAYIHWLGNKEILNLEEENILLAQQSLKISSERMRLGLGNYLEIKESESSYEAALARLVNARYNVKQSETALKKLMGELVK